MEIPERYHSTKNYIDRYHESLKQEERRYLGASELGHYCDRYLWLKYNKKIKEKFKGRMLRLFRRGQLEENVVLEDLKNIGCKVYDEQKGFKDGDIAGHIDGIVVGIPEDPGNPHLLEIKTHNKKSFELLKKDGVKKSKLQHWVQMQIYMYKMELDRSLYFSICKDNDEIYTERIKIDKESANLYLSKGHELTTTKKIPSKISNNSSWYQCKMCSGWEYCHG